LYGLGEQMGLAITAGSQHFTDIDSLNAAVLLQLPKLASVLVKGSRFMKMERVVEAITSCAQRPNDNKDIHHAA